MSSMADFLRVLYLGFSIKDALDIGIVAFGIYWLLLLIRGTRAIQMLAGLFILILVLAASQYFQLFTTQWILDKFLGSLLLIIVVVFQHDIRRALTRVGRGVFYPQLGRWEETQILEEIVNTSTACAARRIGALIVLERETSLENFVEMGDPLDAKVTRDLLVSIFMPGSPLHDGAVIIQAGKLIAAGCILPLTGRLDVGRDMGTRHRAALGITEETDAVVIVVSEQTGQISVAEGGMLRVSPDAASLGRLLQEALSRRSVLSRRAATGAERQAPVAAERAAARPGEEGAGTR